MSTQPNTNKRVERPDSFPLDSDWDEEPPAKRANTVAVPLVPEPLAPTTADSEKTDYDTVSDSESDDSDRTSDLDVSDSHASAKVSSTPAWVRAAVHTLVYAAGLQKPDNLDVDIPAIAEQIVKLAANKFHKHLIKHKQYATTSDGIVVDTMRTVMVMIRSMPPWMSRDAVIQTAEHALCTRYLCVVPAATPKKHREKAKKYPKPVARSTTPANPPSSPSSSSARAAASSSLGVVAVAKRPISTNWPELLQLAAERFGTLLRPFVVGALFVLLKRADGTASVDAQDIRNMMRLYRYDKLRECVQEGARVDGSVLCGVYETKGSQRALVSIHLRWDMIDALAAYPHFRTQFIDACRSSSEFPEVCKSLGVSAD